jgi:hypothetical protein
MAGKQRYTTKQVLDALNHCNGLFYLAAERLGCTRLTIRNYAKRYPKIRQAVLEKRGRRVDIAEAALDKAVLAGEGWAVQFILRTLGRSRGYGEKTDVNVKAKVKGQVETERVVIYVPDDGRNPAPDTSRNGTIQPS